MSICKSPYILRIINYIMIDPFSNQHPQRIATHSLKSTGIQMEGIVQACCSKGIICIQEVTGGVGVLQATTPLIRPCSYLPLSSPSQFANKNKRTGPSLIIFSFLGLSGPSVSHQS